MTRPCQTFIKRLLQGLLVGLLALAASPAQAQRYIYWTSQDDGAINRMTEDGSVKEEPWITLTAGSQPVCIAVDAGHVYWADNFNGQIGRAALNGTNLEEAWITGLNHPYGVCVDANYVYFSEVSGNFDGALGITLGAIDREPINRTAGPFGGQIFLEPFSDGGTNPAPAYSVKVAGGYLYWATQGDRTTDPTTGSKIWRTLLSSVNPADPRDYTVELLVTGCWMPTDLAVNATYVYWVNNAETDGTAFTRGSIGRAKLDGSGVNQALITGLGEPSAICVDNNLYYAIRPSADPSIWKAGNDGSSPTQFLIPASPRTIGGITTTQSPNLITLTTLTATPGASRVELAWKTGSEVNTTGFNVLRASTPGGPFTRVNAALIPATGTGVAGASYAFTDTALTAGTYHYQLQDLDTRGVSTVHGPVSATVGAASAIASFQATPTSVFLGGGSLLAWSVNGTPTLTLNGAAVTGSSLWVLPEATTPYTLAAAQGDATLLTVTVKPFALQDMAGLSRAWGHARGEAAYDPSYDLNGDGRVDDLDVSILFKGM